MINAQSKEKGLCEEKLGLIDKLFVVLVSLFLVLVLYKIGRDVCFENKFQEDKDIYKSEVMLSDIFKNVKRVNGVDLIETSDLKPSILVDRSEMRQKGISNILIDGEQLYFLGNWAAYKITNNSINNTDIAASNVVYLPKVVGVDMIRGTDTVRNDLSIVYKYGASPYFYVPALWTLKNESDLVIRSADLVLKGPVEHMTSKMIFNRSFVSDVDIEVLFDFVGNKLNFGVFLGEDMTVLFGDGNNSVIRVKKYIVNNYKYKNISLLKKRMRDGFVPGNTYRICIVKKGYEYSVKVLSGKGLILERFSFRSIKAHSNKNEYNEVGFLLLKGAEELRIKEVVIKNMN